MYMSIRQQPFKLLMLCFSPIITPASLLVSLHRLGIPRHRFGAMAAMSASPHETLVDRMHREIEIMTRRCLVVMGGGFCRLGVA